MIPLPQHDLSTLVFDSDQHPPIVPPEGDFWLFAYGSLMWNPEFEYLRSETARLYGYQRRLCLWSVEYRGCTVRPGLVMGLDRGGSCVGRAYLICESIAQSVIEQLNRREMITGAYQSCVKPLHLQTGERVEAVCLLAKPDHPQYVRNLSIESMAQIVKQAKGSRGDNTDYVLNTVQHMRDMGISAGSLDAVAQKL